MFNLCLVLLLVSCELFACSSCAILLLFVSTLLSTIVLRATLVSCVSTIVILMLGAPLTLRSVTLLMLTERAAAFEAAAPVLQPLLAPTAYLLCVHHSLIVVLMASCSSLHVRMHCAAHLSPVCQLCFPIDCSLYMDIVSIVLHVVDRG